MNRTKLKNYAPQARRDFIQAMIDRAAFYGLTAKKTEPIEERGDSAVIAGRVFPKSVAEKRQKLEKRIKRHGFDRTMEALAYTWFNRLVAIRFMELHGYLDHGYRVLSHPEGKPTPEILEHAEHVELAGLKKETIIDLKLAGNKESELYRTLLIAQCNALHSAMPFLFERIEDETELLLPENLLHSDSLIRKLVEEIEEEDWQEVEIIGWLYQFYISEKKDQVIGKVVASEDIPAATQLFTPNWIVKYLVQNTLGRQWLATYPNSSLRQQMEYYIDPAEQTLEVQEQLRAITPTSLNPEEITLLDPACGSGHILVEAYDLFKSIYLERGYRAKDIPELILQKNLFGLEIDDRAAQLAAFALMMKARADNRRIFEGDAKPKVVAFQDSQGMDAADITHALNSSIPTLGIGSVSELAIDSLLELFENAKTFGSLIRIPTKLAETLPDIEKRLDEVLSNGDLMHSSAHVIEPLIHQACILSQNYDSIATNPPYMGGKGMNVSLKDFARKHYPESKSDLFAFFMERSFGFLKENGSIGLMTPFTWMFIKSYESLRRLILDRMRLVSLIQPEYHSFFESAYVPICTFVIQNTPIRATADFIRLADFYGEQLQSEKTLEAIRNPQCGWRYTTGVNDFNAISGSPIAYWLSQEIFHLFSSQPPVSSVARTAQGLITSDNNRFVRMWHEVAISRIGFRCASREVAISGGSKWFPYNKGGEFRRWYGNCEYVVNWKDDGSEIRNFVDDSGRTRSRPQNMDLYFQPSVSWTDITTSGLATRSFPNGFVFDATGPSAFTTSSEGHDLLLSLSNTVFATMVAGVLNPTMHFQPGDFENLPYPKRTDIDKVTRLVQEAVRISKLDWDADVTSWDFTVSPLINEESNSKRVKCSCETWLVRHEQNCEELRRLEEANNALFNADVGLSEQWAMLPESHDVTLKRRTPEGEVRSLLSYAIGCAMGRYSLDKSGLIYAHSGNEGFDPSKYTTFRADDDGIIPILEADWGIRDDATNRIVEFIGTAWSKEHVDENLKFVAETLGPTKDEQPRDTIRRYLATGFYKHHLSMYKRRPIYWLFSSGKQRAFQCLVYLHRYNEGTLARMRNEYVIPLQGMMSSRIEQLASDLAKSTSTSHRKKLQKEQDSLKKQQAELLVFDEKLKHYADQKIALDLDDGVKVNYGKFGDLLAEVKAVTGGKGED